MYIFSRIMLPSYVDKTYKEEITVMEKRIARSLARTGEAVAKISNSIGCCAMLLHEPKMPDAMQKKNADKESWKK